MKKILSLLLAAAFMTLAGCGGAAGGSAGLDKVKKDGKLIMGTNAAFPSFEYIANNEIVGVDVDIAREIAKDLGVELVVEDMEFDSVLINVQQGKIDVALAGLSIKPERQEMVDFSDEYVTSSQFVIIAKGSGTTVDSLKQPGKLIGVQSGTTGDTYATDEIKGDPNTEEVVRYGNAMIAAQDLINGKCAAVIIDQVPAESIVRANPDKLELLPDSLTEESYAVAVKKGETALLESINATIARLKSEGKIDEFLLKHADA